MHSIPLIIVLICLWQPSFAQSFEDYQRLNASESRLAEFKDDDRTLQLKIQQLGVINQSRKKYKVPLLQLDILASRVANKIAKQAVDGRFMGHFNLEGESPWMRYAFAGGKDHVSENAAAISSDTPLPTSEADILRDMTQMHAAFMAEKAPNDGHKQTCIDANHNFVGIGLAIGNGEFRYYEEYIDRYLHFKEFDTQIKAGQEWTLSVKPISDKHRLWICIVYQQSLQKKLSAKTISSIPSYNDFTKNITYNLAPWELPVPDPNGYFLFNFAPVQKGIYYIQLHLDDKPYIKGKVSTDGKISASGVVVEVK